MPEISALRIELDCIIFGLQKWGGISNYWLNLIGGLAINPALSIGLHLPKNIIYKGFSRDFYHQTNIIREIIPSQFSRYIRATPASSDEVFHTSYYRLPNKSVNRYFVSVYDFTYERFRGGLPRLIHSMQKFQSIKGADSILCISNSTRNDLLEFYPKIDPAKVHVVHLGVDHNKFYIDLLNPGTCNSNMVLFVGERRGYKRFDLAIEAINQSPHLHLGIVGPSLSSHEKLILNKLLPSRWVEFGPVDTGRLRRLYSAAYAFIFPSDYEGFGLPILEAMACGCPVVASCKSSFPEVGGRVAMYAEAQTGEAYSVALERLGSSITREIITRDGLSWSSEFTWLKTVEKTQLLYSL